MIAHLSESARRLAQRRAVFASQAGTFALKVRGNLFLTLIFTFKGRGESDTFLNFLNLFKFLIHIPEVRFGRDRKP